MARIFISYARDDEAVAGTLAAALENQGHTVWWDRQLAGGVEFSREIEEALDSSDKVIVLWSVHSTGSAWVRDEATAAINAQKIVPAAIDGTTPPIGFRQYHTIDLSGWLAHPGRALPKDLKQSLAPQDRVAHDSRAGSHRNHQRIAFACTLDGVRIAYSRLGSGPPLVKAANGYNHLEHELENPLWRHWIEELSRRHTLIRYDQRGTGMSEREISELSFDLLVEDLTAVVDAAGLENFDLVGISQGAPVAIAFSTLFPERVRRLVLINGFARGWRHSFNRDVVDSWEALSILAKSGRKAPGLGQVFAGQYFPDATRAQVDWWNKIQDQSASPEMAQRYFDLVGSIDVRDLLEEIRVPTLVMHSKDDAVVSFDAGCFLASKIPGAEFVALEGINHLPQKEDASWPELQNELRRFLR